MIEKVHIKQYTVLKDFKLDINNRSMLICGKNGIGKSSVLKFIQIALGASNLIPPGANGEGEVYTNKEGKKYQFDVKIKNGKSKVTVKGPDGLSDSRKGTLASIVGAVDLNVTEFIELSKSEKGRKKQVEIFKSMLPEDVREELARLEENVKVAYEERTELSKDVKKHEVKIKANPLNHLMDKELDKFEKVDISATMTEMQALQKHNASVEQVKERMESRKDTIATHEKRIEDIKAELERVEKDLKEEENKQAEATKWLSKPENKVKPLDKHEEIIKNATSTNENYKYAQDIKADKKLLAEMVNDHENYTIRIETGRQAIQDAIKDMAGDLVPGVTYNNEGLIWNDLLVHPDTHSTGEQLELAMKLKMAENPDLQVLFLEHTESLDDDRMNRMLDVAKKEGWQILGEEVRKRQKDMTFELIGEGVEETVAE